MDRHVDFTSHLSHLVALYAHDPVDHAAERSALRAARGAAKHGDIDILIQDGALRAGHQSADVAQPAVQELQMLFNSLGIARVHVVHQAKQEEIKRLAKLLGAVAAGTTDVPAFAHELAQHAWLQVQVERVAPDERAVGAELAEESDAAVADTASVETPAMASMDAEEASTAAAGTVAGADEPAPAAVPALPPPEALPGDLQGTPLADHLPSAVETLVGPAHRELFERLITSSEPSTLRRLLEPVQQAVELAIRQGESAVSVRLVQAMLACEACTTDDEMRRQFVVTLRRLTKPTLLRAYAMLYWDDQSMQSAVEEVLSRFGEDGAEAVADRVGCASTAEARAAYTALLGRLPDTADALVAMLDDERDFIVERALDLMVRLAHPDVEGVLGEQLNHVSLRVRRAAVRGLAMFKSTFTADALARAVQDEAPAVRLEAAVALQGRREPRLASVIVQRIDEETEPDVQLALITVLGRLAASEGVQKLIAMASGDQRGRRRITTSLRIAAIEAMGEARTPASMVALQKLLEDREKDVREAAARLYTRARRQTTSAGVQAVTDS